MIAERDVTVCCTHCGSRDVPIPVGRQTLPSHHDPVTGKVCAGSCLPPSVMLLRRYEAGPWESEEC